MDHREAIRVADCGHLPWSEPCEEPDCLGTRGGGMHLPEWFILPPVHPSMDGGYNVEQMCDAYFARFYDPETGKMP